jgi:hypothetical protein
LTRTQRSESGFQAVADREREETVLGLVVAKLVYLVDAERLAAVRAIRRRGGLVGWAVCGHGISRGSRVLQPTGTDH